MARRARIFWLKLHNHRYSKVNIAASMSLQYHHVSWFHVHLSKIIFIQWIDAMTNPVNVFLDDI